MSEIGNPPKTVRSLNRAMKCIVENFSRWRDEHMQTPYGLIILIFFLWKTKDYFYKGRVNDWQKNRFTKVESQGFSQIIWYVIKPACASVGIPNYFFPFSDQSKAHKQLLQKFHFKKKKRKRVIKTLGALYKYDNFFKKKLSSSKEFLVKLAGKK